MKKSYLIVMSILLVVVGLFSCKSVEQTEIRPWPNKTVDYYKPTTKGMIVAFDCSSSMSNDFDEAKKALLTYLLSLPPDVEVGIVSFGDYVKTVSEIKTHQSGELDKLVNGMSAFGSTPLAEAVAVSTNLLGDWYGKQVGYAECHLVIVTDGEADNKDLLAERVASTLQLPVRIFTIGFNIKEHHTLNIPGKIRYVSADNIEELSKGLERILLEKEE